LRLQARAGQGLGKGGGYFERSDPADRRETTEDKEGDYDVYGRRRFAVADPSGVQGSGADESGGADRGAAPEGGGASERSGKGPRNSISSAGHIPSKAERQRIALERLRNPQKRKASLSPPRTRNFREATSRSRSRDRKKRAGFILSGGLHLHH